MQDSKAVTDNKVDLLDLNDLRIFTYVAVLFSFSAAAEELGISKSSVSRSIVRLEVLMGTQLFNRTTRKVKLTRAGNVLKDRGVEIMKRIGETIGYVGGLGLAPQGQLAICVATDAGLEEQIQQVVLPGFLKRYDKVSVVLRFTSQKSELRAESVDVAISSGPSHPAGSSRFLTMSQWFCASPAYLDRHGPIATPEDLDKHDTIAIDDHETHVPGLGNTLDFFNNPHSRLNTNDMAGARALAVLGIGVVCLPEHFCKSEVQKGELVRLLPDLVLRPLDLHISYPSKRSAAPAVKAFAELLKASLNAASSTISDTSALQVPAKHATQ
ncbi:LysR family transcriptional activator of dmlA [Variovorax boronicumulans]|uniref:LysR family transcriptional regulator n=1 Tax=Variovorax boronicumulans TaxID=436515 RepID=UPI0024749C4C|nr:LysR family transcriptional regulator [Variovorax boronicumulans]MDH6170950.1 LysR family transcriptional activator of dmlA [Variovorax boronicumulans]